MGAHLQCHGGHQHPGVALATHIEPARIYRFRIRRLHMAELDHTWLPRVVCGAVQLVHARGPIPGNYTNQLPVTGFTNVQSEILGTQSEPISAEQNRRVTVYYII